MARSRRAMACAPVALPSRGSRTRTCGRNASAGLTGSSKPRPGTHIHLVPVRYNVTPGHTEVLRRAAGERAILAAGVYVRPTDAKREEQIGLRSSANHCHRKRRFKLHARNRGIRRVTASQAMENDSRDAELSPLSRKPETSPQMSPPAPGVRVPVGRTGENLERGRQGWLLRERR